MTTSSSQATLPWAGSTHKACEFCTEISRPQHSHFWKVYAPLTRTRIIERSEGIIVMPTIGQLFAGSLLLLPEEHYETSADLPFALRYALENRLTRVRVKVSGDSPALVFEHGARARNGNGCGIYHAHIHVVPVPNPVDSDSFLGNLNCDEKENFSSMVEAFDWLRGAEEYLLFSSSPGFAECFKWNSANGTVGSQFVRRRIVEHFRLARNWNWRTYSEPEEELLKTIAMFQMA